MPVIRAKQAIQALVQGVVGLFSTLNVQSDQNIVGTAESSASGYMRYMLKHAASPGLGFTVGQLWLWSVFSDAILFNASNALIVVNENRSKAVAAINGNDDSLHVFGGLSVQDNSGNFANNSLVNPGNGTIQALKYKAVGNEDSTSTTTGDYRGRGAGFTGNVNIGGSLTVSGRNVLNAIDTLLTTIPTTGARILCGLRLINSSYTGNAIRVRRSSDNAETNIGFSNGTLDTTSLLSFVGNSDGFVTTIYDQSGNNQNLVAPNNAAQGKIVVAGTLQTQNGKPSILFSGAQYYDTTLSSAISKVVGNVVMKPTNFNNNRVLAVSPTSTTTDWNNPSAAILVVLPNSSSVQNYTNGTPTSVSVNASTLCSVVSQFDGANCFIQLNAAITVAARTTTLAATVARVGAGIDSTPGNYFQGFISEITLYDRSLRNLEKDSLISNQQIYYGM